MDRRTFLGSLAGGLLAGPLAAEGQQPEQIPKVDWLSAGIRSNGADLYGAFIKEFRTLGYVDGRNTAIERRNAAGRLGQLPALAAELVRIPVDVIVATEGVPATRAAKNATRL